MGFLVACALKDLRRRLADPAALAVWIGIPLLLAGLMNLVAGNANVAPRAKVLVVDQDATLLSGLLIRGAASGRLGELVEVEGVALPEGERRINAGEASALLILPKGFQSAVLEQTPAQLTLVTNPSERILPGIIQEALEVVVEVVFYGQRIFGPSIRRIVSGIPGQPSDIDVASISVEINQQIARRTSSFLRR